MRFVSVVSWWPRRLSIINHSCFEKKENWAESFSFRRRINCLFMIGCLRTLVGIKSLKYHFPNRKKGKNLCNWDKIITWNETSKNPDTRLRDKVTLFHQTRAHTTSFLCCASLELEQGSFLGYWKFLNLSLIKTKELSWELISARSLLVSFGLWAHFLRTVYVIHRWVAIMSWRLIYQRQAIQTNLVISDFPGGRQIAISATDSPAICKAALYSFPNA